MKSCLHARSVLLLLLLALAPVGRAAPATPSTATYADTAAPTRPPLVSIDFPGGSLTKFLATISQDHRVSFNIIGVGEATDFSLELPPFSLRNAELHVVAAVLRELLQPRGFELIPIGGQPDSLGGTDSEQTPGRFLDSHGQSSTCEGPFAGVPQNNFLHSPAPTPNASRLHEVTCHRREAVRCCGSRARPR